MRVVVDASVALKWFFHSRPNGTDVGAAMAILDAIKVGRIDVLAPPHWLAEVLAVIAREAPLLVDGALSALVALDFPVMDTHDVYKCAAELSIRRKHHLFDTLYHAIALEHDGTLVTDDQRYFKAARAEGRIALLRNFRLPP